MLASHVVNEHHFDYVRALNFDSNLLNGCSSLLICSMITASLFKNFYYHLNHYCFQYPALFMLNSVNCLQSSLNFITDDHCYSAIA